MSDKHTDAQGEQTARNKWNSIADEFNQWDELGQDEKDSLIAKIRATEGQAQTREVPNVLEPAVIALDSAIHKVLIAGGDYGDELSDIHLRDTLKQAQHVAYRALISIGIDRLPGAVNPLSSFLPAAQLADSTAPGAPFAWVTSDRKHIVFADRVSGDESTKGMSPLYFAAPTAQQSLTAGGSVPDLRNTISNAIYGYGAMLEDHVGTVDAIAKAITAANQSEKAQ